jgi:Mg2+/Co2+ transporter CorC
VPKRGEQIRIENLLIRILRADSRRLHLLQVERVEEQPSAANAPR